jgi:fructose/tagatose bisphosphate aldolase
MPQVKFRELMDEAERGGYAVGYFESWSLESLLAVADAAERLRSPVILGFSGMALPSPDRRVADPLPVYAEMARAVIRGLSVPACLLFNESPYLEAVFEAIDLGFGLVMYTDEGLAPAVLEERIAGVVAYAHPQGVAVEGELTPLVGVGGGLTSVPDNLRLTDPEAARGFVERTGIDAMAVNIGQAHLHGRARVRLDLDRLARLRRDVPVSLVLHGASSIDRADLEAAIGLGIRKINVGSALKQAFFEAVRRACLGRHDPYNPYEVIGSGLEGDILVQGRLAMQDVVEAYLRLFGSAGKAGSPAR